MKMRYFCNIETNTTKRRSFASFLWSLVWKEKKSVKTKKGIMNIPYQLERNLFGKM
jgi:hypothetical protein